MSEIPDEAVGLRAALEKLCVELEEYDDSITAVTLRALLAQHPASQPRPAVPDLAGALRESVDAARSCRLGRPVVDREALAALLLYEEGSEWAEGTNRHYELADTILALLPTEAQSVDRSSSTS